MVLDIADPAFDAEESFDSFCKECECILRKGPMNQFGDSLVWKWIYYSCEYKDINDNIDDLKVKLLKLWFVLGWIKNSDHITAAPGAYILVRNKL